MLGAHPAQPQAQSSFLEASRSPPSKNLSHVPCKFFRQGTCQAGNTCPFSHSIDSQLEQAPCKYFQKGNCKFGAKCALAHILPDGRRVNHRALPQNYGPLQLGTRNMLPDVNNNSYANNPSALARSLIAHNRQPQQQNSSSALQTQDNDFGYDFVGSPPADTLASPSSHRTLGPLDVPIPASLEANGISFLARHGPVAASVPAKFGLDTSSLPSSSAAGGDLSTSSSSHALRSLYMSAYGVEAEQVQQPRIGNIGSRGLSANEDPNSSSSSSPPGVNHTNFSSAATNSSSALPLQFSQASDGTEDTFGFTPISSATTSSRRYVSASFPARPSIWKGGNALPDDQDEFFPIGTPSSQIQSLSHQDVFLADDGNNDNFAFEEDFVPSSLNELLTPQERKRRGSRHDDLEFSSSFNGRSTGAIGDGIISSSPRYGTGESPRFGQLFHGPGGRDGLGAPLRYTPLSVQGNSGNESPFFASPPRVSLLANSAIAPRKEGPGSRSGQAGTRKPPPPSSYHTAIAEDDENELSRPDLDSGIVDEEEMQFIMDEEQNHSGSNDSNINGISNKLDGLYLSR
ncbi:hypothetical protein V1514DRAFT_117213 [Lipomyces japonicus]|uniref:uncharacterized protein n=1 Tax=Lipomyces japonicus TaxID=56871 RepID=UPI0034CD0E14